MKNFYAIEVSNFRESARSLHKACRAEPAFVHRANLDPEISPILALYPLQQIVN